MTRIEYVENRWQYEPGNGTRYCIIATRLSGYTSCGAMGAVTDGWLVADGLGRAYLFSSDDRLHPNYVAEKFGLDPDGQDVCHLTALINYVIMGQDAGQTGDVT